MSYTHLRTTSLISDLPDDAGYNALAVMAFLQGSTIANASAEVSCSKLGADGLHYTLESVSRAIEYESKFRDMEGTI